MQFLEYHLHSADDHAVRWKWTVGSVAMWDNRCVDISRCCQMLTTSEAVLFTELYRDSMIVFGEASVRLCLARSVSQWMIYTVADRVDSRKTAYFDPASQSRSERARGKIGALIDGTNGHTNGHANAEKGTALNGASVPA